MFEDIYEEVILDASRSTKNRKVLTNECVCVKGFNPICGDRVEIFSKLIAQNSDPEDRFFVQSNPLALTFNASGCAISQASAQLLIEHLNSLNFEEASEQLNCIYDLMLKKRTLTNSEREKIGKLVVFENISDFPMRTKCATMSLHALKELLDLKDEKFKSSFIQKVGLGEVE